MDTLLIYEAPKEEREAMSRLLGERCNKVQLQFYAQALTNWMGHFDDVKKIDAEGQENYSALLNGLFRSNASKDALLAGLALVFADRRNLQAYVESIGKNMQKLWRNVLLNIIVSHDSAKEALQTKKPLFKSKSGYHYYYDRQQSIEWSSPDLLWFSTANYRSVSKSNYGYREYEEFITIKPIVHRLFLPVFFEWAADDAWPGHNRSDAGSSAEAGVGSETADTGDDAPSGQRIFNFESESVGAYQLFSALMERGELPLRKSGVGLTDIKRVQKSMGLTEFFSDEEYDEYRARLRSQSYLRLMALCEHIRPKKSKKPATYEAALRDLFANLDYLDIYLPALLYPHVKGLRRQTTEYGRCAKLCQLMLVAIQEATVPGDSAAGAAPFPATVPGGSAAGAAPWIDIFDILVRIYMLEPERNSTRFTAQVFHPDDEQWNTEIFNEYCKQLIPANGYVSNFGLTGLKSFAYMLCSLGVVELQVSEESNENRSPFDDAERLRLTPLGRYALGITDSYEAPELELVAYFELDPDRLIIRSLVDPNPYAQLLLDTSKPISRNRYETSALSFLATCHRREDVEGKISIFRRFIADELPPLWEQFFQSLLQHCHPLKEDKTAYKRYTIDPANRDLIALLTTDTRLRSLITRAEHYLILVKNDDLPRFENELKKHGYLL